MRDTDVPRILEVYHDAFAGAPWFEDLSNEELQRRWFELKRHALFDGLVFEKNRKIVGVHLWYYLTPTILAKQRGQKLVDWLTREINLVNMRKKVNPRITLQSILIIWEAEVIVHPDFQGQGIATLLRKQFIEKMQKRLIYGLVLSRMRDDNIGSIKTAEKLGFRKTGVQQPAREKPKMHDYWYLKLNM